MITFIFSFFCKILFAVEEPVIFYEQDPSLLTTNIKAVLLSGAMYDPMDKAGATNMMAEFILRGTKRKSRTAFQNAVERLGATIESDTSHDAIYIYGEVIAENTIPFLELLEEALLQPAFRMKEFTQLKKEISDDLLYLKNDNMSLAKLAIQREIFSGTPLEFPLSGTIRTIKNINIKTILDSYNRAFKRENFVFAISSPLSEKTIKDKITKLWLKYPKRKEKPATPKITLNIPSSPKIIVINKTVPSTGSIIMAQRGIKIQDTSRYTLLVGNYAFGLRPLISRLFKIIRSEHGWTYSIGSSYEAINNLSSQEGVFGIYASPSVEHSFSVIEKSLQMWKEFLENGLSKEEFKLSKEGLINSYPFMFDSASKRLRNKLISHIYSVPILSPKEYETTINNVTNKNLLAALKEKHTDRGWIISIVADKNEFKKQLEKFQKEAKKDKFEINKILEPDDLI